MPWAVSGGARTSVHLNVVECLHNIKTKRFFNAGKWAGLWQEMLGSAAQPSTWMCLNGCITFRRKEFLTPWKELSRVWESTAQPQVRMFFKNLLPSKGKKFFKTVKCVRPWLGEHDQPLIWTLLKVCTTTKQNDSSTPRSELGRDRGCWDARPSHQLECFYMAADNPYKWILQQREQNWAVFGGAQPSHKFEYFWKASYHPDKKILQHRENPWTVFGEARTSVRLNVVECLHDIKTKWFFNAAKWAGPWQKKLRSAAQQSTW